MYLYFLFFKKLIVSIGLFLLLIGVVTGARAQSSTGDFVSMINGWKADGSNLIGSANDTFSFSFNDSYTSYRTIKVYVPAGTSEFGVAGFLPQQTPYAVVARFGRPPERTTALGGGIDTGEYGDINRVFSQPKAFAQLLAGQEMIQVHDGGGSMGYSGVANLVRRPLLKGKWLYMRVLNDPSGRGIYNLQGGGSVDRAMYIERMAGIQFQSDGVPVEDLTLPERPTGIVLRPSTVAAGNVAVIEPDNPNAIALGRCNVDTANPIARHVTISNYKISVATDAPPGVIKISCGDATNFSSDSAFSVPVFNADLTVGTPAPLQNLSLSANFININNPVPITVSPVPANATIGSCNLDGVGSTYATITGNSINLKSGIVLTTPVDASVICSGISAPFRIQPPPSLVLTPSFLQQGSGAVVTITKSDGVPASSCQLSAAVPATTINPNTYLDVAAGRISFKVASAALPQTPSEQTVAVTCDGSLTANLVLRPAPVGLLYPLHNNEAGSGVTPLPTVRNEKLLLLRWRAANSNGDVTYGPLDGKYPSYPTSSSTEFVCAEVDNADLPITPERIRFIPATTGSSGSTAPMMELTTVADALSVPTQTRVLCYVQGRALGSGAIEESKTRLIINLTSGKWELAVPTLANPVLDASTSIGNAKLQVYVPRATTPTADVPVAIFIYVNNSSSVAPGGAFITPGGLKLWDGNLNESELIYTTVPASAASRVVDVDMLFSKVAYIQSQLGIKARVFYRDGTRWLEGWKQLTNPATEWDSTR